MNKLFIILYLLLRYETLSNEDVEFEEAKFPEDFMFGVSTSAYQIEGGWDADGRAECIWDRLIHESPHKVLDNNTADRAADSYNLYKEDVEMLKYLGVDFYRFSISWPRMFPNGRGMNGSSKGVDYYNSLIDELVKNNITPMVTMYHWDLPQTMQDDGGFLNPKFPLYFAEYAEFCFKQFGDRVKYWTTFNEPKEICLHGYGQSFRAPQLNYHGYGEYICNKHLLEGHARAYHIYNTTYRATQKGLVGLTFSAQWMDPETNKSEDIEAAEDARQFNIGLFVHPIYSKQGGYPPRVSSRVPPERLPLPELPDDIPLIGTSDFMGINHYNAYLVNRNGTKPERPVPSFEDDQGVNEIRLMRWSKSWVNAVPSGFSKLLLWLTKEYDRPQIFIMENGKPYQMNLDDKDRVWFIRRYLAEVLRAIQGGARVKGYSYWSLMDNFEWFRGYVDRFGLYQIDFDSPNRTRTPRRSAHVYKQLISTKTIDPDYMNNVSISDIKWPVNPIYAFMSTFDERPAKLMPIQQDVAESKESRTRTNAKVTIIDIVNSQLLYGVDSNNPEVMDMNLLN